MTTTVKKKIRLFLGRRARQAIANGHKNWVVHLCNALRLVSRGNRAVAEFQVKALISHPATMEQIERAIQVAAQTLRQAPTQRGVNVLCEAILAKAIHIGPTAPILEDLSMIDDVDMRAAFPGLRSLATALIDQGHSASLPVLEKISEINMRTSTEFVHESLVSMGEIDAAAKLIDESRNQPWMSEPVLAVLQADQALATADPNKVLSLLDSIEPERPAAFNREHLRSTLANQDYERLLDHLDWLTKLVLTSVQADQALAAADPNKALSLLDSVKPYRSQAFSKRYATAALSAGRHDRLLGYLDTYTHNLSPLDEASYRFEAHWAMGQASDAKAALAEFRLDNPLEPRMLRNEHRLMTLTQDDATEQLSSRLRAAEGDLNDLTAAEITHLMASYEFLGCLDDIERLATALPDKHLSPASRVHLARARYVRRDFEGATAALQPLRGSLRRWDGEKLAARIRFEIGDASGALESRAHRRPSAELDEVEFHSLLLLGRFEEAFALYLPPADIKRVQQVFPKTAHVNGLLESVNHRFIIMQSGPGDEIMLASLYSEATRYSERLSATCEPRLAPLLRQSFPSIEFLPVGRITANDFGWLRDSPDRVTAGPLASLLDEKALKVAQNADSVVMGRSLPSALGSAGLPAASYLRPSDEARARVAKLHRGRPVVGLVWRSEMRSPIRNIHYLEVSQLAELLPDGTDVICLQHDVTAEERKALASTTQSLINLEGIDLRNDFDSAAAVVSLCDVVLGVGTTITELAGAVGTHTVMLQPTHFGTWRAQGDSSRDYWHKSMLVSAVDEPWKREKLIPKARSQLNNLLNSL